MEKNNDGEKFLIVLFFVVLLTTEGLIGLEMLWLGLGWLACISLVPAILFVLLMGYFSPDDGHLL